MTATQIRNQLKAAFGVSTTKELKAILKKTDLRRKDQMLHAAAVIWSYSYRYPVKNRQICYQIMCSQSEQRQNVLAFEAKNGFGSYAA